MERAGVGMMWVLTAILALVACGGDEDSPAAAPSTPATAGTAPNSTSTAPGSPATALFGDWNTVIAQGDSVTLTLREGSYTIRRGPDRGSGRLQATATEAVFSGSDLCDGLGTYRWSVKDGTLSLESIAKDACGARAEVLDGKTFKK